MPSNLLIASGYDIKAKFQLELTTVCRSFPVCSDKYPKIPKIVKPAIKLVIISIEVTIRASLNGKYCLLVFKLF